MPNQRLYGFTAVASILVMFTGCLQNTLDVIEIVEVQTTMTVNSDSLFCSAEQVFDAVAEDDVFQKYADRLQGIEILQIQYAITRYAGSPEQHMHDFSIGIAQSDGSQFLTLSTMQEVDFRTAAYADNLPYSKPAAMQMARYMLHDPHRCMIYLTGEMHEVPADFTLMLAFRIKMVAEVF